MSDFVDFNDIKTNIREAEWKLDNGQRVGLYLRLRYETAPEVQAVHRRFEKQVMDASMRGGRKADRERAREEFKTNRLVAHVAGWRWHENAPGINGEKPDFSPKVLRSMLNSNSEGAVMLRKFIENEVGDAEDFLASSGTDSPNT